MRSFTSFQLTDISACKSQLLQWLASFNTCMYLDTNAYQQDPYHAYELIAGAGIEEQLLASAQQNPFEQLDTFYQQQQDWLLGFFSYELKNSMKRLHSGNVDHIQFPDLFFFQPQHLFLIQQQTLWISSLNREPEDLFREVCRLPLHPSAKQEQAPELQARMNRHEYLQNVQSVQQHIRHGDVYELNLCQEFFAEGVSLDHPAGIFETLNKKAEAPFSAYVQWNGRYLLCSSPERYLAKRGSKLISQPIKGTARRGMSQEEDIRLQRELRESIKEQAENVMIVDLVRNDLARHAITGSVQVEELFGIYSYKHVHQMISTITAKLHDDSSFASALRDSFPMGSMTGAPKVSAMELIDYYETTKRGLFSGSVGYVTPNGHVDANVVIRSILYNALKPYISVQVGGAITIDSDPEREYEECLVKARGMLEVLGAHKILGKPDD